MIKKLEIQNFQAHKDTTLEFSPGVNIIVGSSDSGKSSLIRALRWAVYGKPRGDSVRSWWGGNTSVTITVEEGFATRLKTNALNQYTTQDIEFNAIGHEVPQEVVDLLNFEDMNLQQQADAPFLFSETAGEVAQHFNRMANLEKIDESLKAIQSALRATEQTLKHKQQDFKEQQDKQKEYDWIPEADEQVEALEETHKEMEICQENIQALQTSINTCHSIDESLNRLTYVSGASVSINILLKKGLELEQKKKDIIQLSDSLATLKRIEARTVIGTAFVKADKPVTTLFAYVQEFNELEKKRKEIQRDIQTIKTLTESEEHTLSNLTGNIDRYHNDFPDQCPFCENETNLKI